MIFVYCLAALCAGAVLLARRFAWAAGLGMALGAALLLAALVAGASTGTLQLCLLAPCAVALLPKGGRP